MKTRLDRALALGVASLFLVLYMRTLAPGLLPGDAGEFHFAAWRFGLAHPTGYPLYLILGGLWQHAAALLGVDPARALNAFSAVLAAATVGLLYLLMVQWIAPARDVPSSLRKGNRIVRRAGALLAALLLGANPAFWSQAVIAEVYPLHALFLAGFFLAAQALIRQMMGFGDDGTLKRIPALTPSPPPPVTGRARGPAPTPVTLSLLLGLALTHHRTSLFLLPGLILLLFWLDRAWWRRGRLLLGVGAGLALPQLLYLYVPLRSGPDASPWLYPHLDGETLALYTNTWRGFLNFVTGRVFAVSLLGLEGAVGRLSQMADLWLVHFTWAGLGLMGLGLFALVRQRRWDVLILTVPFALIHQVFNLFYGIGDIFVYYIALYLIGAIWAGFGAQRLGDWFVSRTTHHAPRAASRMAYGVLLLLLPVFLLTRGYARMDQSGNTAARQMWETILAAEPPGDAILVSNDRNEIVPLYYLQAVEARAPGITGLFPLISPEARFTDVGAVVATALGSGGGRPVYLIKEMPGLEVLFELEPAPGPLVRVAGTVAAPDDLIRLDLPYGPLTLLGYRLERTGGPSALTLYWRVAETPDADYTTTVQLFAGERKLAQEDRPPGGVYYPTSLWKPGQVLRERHRLSTVEAPDRLLVALYRAPDGDPARTQPEFVYLASPLTIGLPGVP